MRGLEDKSSLFNICDLAKPLLDALLPWNCKEKHVTFLSHELTLITFLCLHCSIAHMHVHCKQAIPDMQWEIYFCFFTHMETNRCFFFSTVYI